MFKNNETVLVLAPHTDDGELGCGATLSKLSRMGCEIHYLAFCSCDESLPPGMPKGTLVNELMDAALELKIPKDNVRVEEFEVRRLSYHRQDILDLLVKINRDLKPNVVFCPTVDDLHQDHSVVAIEARRAFKTKTLLGYEMPWNNIHFEANFMVRVTEEDVEKKISALSNYHSQKGRKYMQPRFIRSLAYTRGVSIGVDYAEAFTMYRGIY